MSKTRHDSELYRADVKKGKCGVCSREREPGTTGKLCHRCATRQRRANRERYRRNHPDHAPRRIDEGQLWEEIALLDHVDCLPSRL